MAIGPLSSTMLSIWQAFNMCWLTDWMNENELSDPAWLVGEQNCLYTASNLLHSFLPLKIQYNLVGQLSSKAQFF